MQESTDRRIDQNFGAECGDPWTAESVRIFKGGVAGIHGPRNRSEFFKRDAGIYDPSIQFGFLKYAGIHGPPNWSEFLKKDEGIHGPLNRSDFLKGGCRNLRTAESVRIFKVV